MTDRMAKFRRLLRLVHLLADSAEGLTLDEMAQELDVTRRTAERMRDVIDEAFGLDVLQDDRRKRFRIPDGLRRAYTRPNATEVAALQAEVRGLRGEGTVHAEQLESLLGKVKAAFDDREKRRLDPDLEALVRLQRSRVLAGPALIAEPEALVSIQGAILAGTCIEFEYRADGSQEAQWRRIVPYGLIHGPVTYLIGAMPGRDVPPATYRLDRMSEVRASNQLGCVPEDWDLDRWMERSFGIWHGDEHDIVLRVLAPATARARAWRFHPAQQVTEDGDTLRIRFRAGGLREIAEHLFTWGGDIRIEAPEELRAVMRERLELGMNVLNCRMAAATEEA